MANRIVNVSGQRFVDNSPGIFPSWSTQPVIYDNRINYFDDPRKRGCHDFVTTPMSDDEIRLTKKLRDSAAALGRYFQMSKLKQQPMRAQTNMVAMMLPYDHDPSLPDFLAYTDPLYQRVITTLVDRLLKVAQNDAEAEDICYLLTDYSYSAPFASMLRHDGRMKITSWDSRRMEYFAAQYEEYLAASYRVTDARTCAPPLNVTKSLGFNTHLPDGTVFDRSDPGFLFYPKDLQTFHDGKLELNSWFRRNVAPVRLEWCKSGRAYENLDFFLDNCDRYLDEKVFFEAFMREACAVHTEAYRYNNPDPILNPLDDLRKGTAKQLGHLYKKNRDGAAEFTPYTFSSWVEEDRDFGTWLRSQAPEHLLNALKKRPMFPSNNASFGFMFTYLFNRILHPVEKGAGGFPTNRKVIIQRVSEFLEDPRPHKTFWLLFDRRTSEQFLTDNFELVVRLFPKGLQRIMLGLGCAALPSLHGARVVAGSLVSGAPETTFTNITAGLFENTNATCDVILGGTVDPTHVIDEVLSQVFTGAPETHWNDQVSTLHFLGTDDQVIGVKIYDTSIIPAIERRLENFISDRWLSGELTQNGCVFGQVLTESSFLPKDNSVLRQILLLEHTKNGDQAALKYHARFSCMEDRFLRVFADTFRDFHLGSISTYEKGAIEYGYYLKKFGYPLDGEVNEYSAKDVYIGKYLKEHGIDPITGCNKYPEELLTPLDDRFNQIFN